jgi:hypothetical protein
MMTTKLTGYILELEGRKGITSGPGETLFS